MFSGLVFLGSGRKRIRLNRKIPAHLVGTCFNLVLGYGRGCDMWGSHRVSDSDHKRRRCEQNHDGFIPSHGRTGVG